MTRKNLSNKTVMILGGDGYLGWSLGLAFANRTNNKVILVDNLIKRNWEKEVNAKLLIPIKKPAKRIAAYNGIYNKNNLFFEKLDLLNKKELDKIVKKYNPTVIINAAQQPSAPFSMMNAKNASVTFLNNIVGHLNVLWSIAENNKNIRYIKLGSAGCYMDTDTNFLPLEKKDFSFNHNGKKFKLLKSFIPMQATDFYHQSKISDFLIDDLCAKLWKLKVITVQQATIFGATIEENHSVENETLSARFNYDAVFSTVINRFVCQLVIGHPLTVYGDGKQKTGLISLSDSVENIMKLTKVKVTPGEHTVVHNYTHRYSIEEIAKMIAKVDPNANINYIKNPRKEPEGRLNRQVELHDSIINQQENKKAKFETEIAKMIEFTGRHKDNIDQSIIMPKVLWDKINSEKKESIWNLKYITKTTQILNESMKSMKIRYSSIMNSL